MIYHNRKVNDRWIVAKVNKEEIELARKKVISIALEMVPRIKESFKDDFSNELLAVMLNKLVPSVESILSDIVDKKIYDSENK